MKITISIVSVFLLLQLAASAQTTVHYDYDVTGNRIKRWSDTYPIAPPQNNLNTTTTIAEDVQKLIKLAPDLTPTSEGDIKIFPNPVKGKLNVQFTGTANANGSSLQMYDNTGKLFLQQSDLQNLTEINVQHSKSGIYFLVVIDKDGKRMFWKLVKQ